MPFTYEKTAALIKYHFPQIYREEGPLFIEFVKKYYEWMETANTAPVYHTRRMSQYKDIDRSTDEFIVHFKEKYLKDIQLDTETNTVQLLKHSLDLYRSKGTPRAIDLFFKIVFGTPAEVYYPGSDIFRLSAAKWKIPRYMEVSPAALNRSMVGRTIVGLQSGATAFVERLVRKRVNSAFVEVFYISAIVGDFLTGETVKIDGAASSVGFPQMLGSLTELEVNDGGSGFAVGDTVDLVSSSAGSGGKAKVASIESISGTVEFELVDGGWGYTANAEVIIADTVIRLSNTVLTSGNSDPVWPLMGQPVSQPKANIAYTEATGTFADAANVYSYYSNGSVKGVGRIMSTTTSNSSTGAMLVAILSGNLNANHVGTAANAVLSNTVGGYTSTTANGIIYGVSGNVTIAYSNSALHLTPGETVYQVNSTGGVFANGEVISISTTGLTGTARIARNFGLFQSNVNLVGVTSGANLVIDTISLALGLANVTGSFVATDSNYTVFDSKPCNATCFAVAGGTGAGFSISSNLAYTEAVNISTALISPMVAVQLNAADYGATLNNATLATVLDTAFTYASYTLGEITSLTAINPGADYDYSPFVAIREPNVSIYNKQDFVMRISNTSGTFSVGELVTQNATSAQAKVKIANATHVVIKRMNFANTWIASANNSVTYRIAGSSSGAYAQIDSIENDIYDDVMGFNAVVTTNVVTSNSAVATLRVVSSGLSYVNGQTVEFVSSDGLNSGTASAVVNKQGFGEGYYQTTAGFLSTDKYFYDGEYYQNFSYEVKTAVTLSKYEEMLKKLLHVAGTKYFGTVVNKSVVNATISSITSNRTIS